MMLDDVLRSLISLKHSVKHRKTFLLFPSLMNNVWFVWTACKTLLDSRTRTRPSLILTWGISVPESLSSTIFYKTCFTLLDSFGQPVKQCWMFYSFGRTLKEYFSNPRYLSSYDGKRPQKIESQTNFSKKNRTEMRKNGKNNCRKSPEGARKYVGSDVRGGTCFPGMFARKSFKFDKSWSILVILKK